MPATAINFPDQFHTSNSNQSPSKDTFSSVYPKNKQHTLSAIPAIPQSAIPEEINLDLPGYKHDFWSSLGFVKLKKERNGRQIVKTKVCIVIIEYNIISEQWQ